MKKHYQILCGRSDTDCVISNVISTEEEAKAYAASIASYESSIRRRPVACVIKEGYGASFRNYDILICDCI